MTIDPNVKPVIALMELVLGIPVGGGQADRDLFVRLEVVPAELNGRVQYANGPGDP